MLPRKALSLLLLIAATALLAMGCGGSSDDSSSDSSSSSSATTDDTSEAADLPEGTVAVELGEFFVKPSSPTVAAGDVTFQVENVGDGMHELVVYKTDEAADKLEQDGTQAKLDEASVLGQTAELQSGDKEELKVTLEAGKYLLLCNLPGHYSAGQVIEFTVE